ncbi:hypothetical protein [Amycolatopsis sp. WGS_07]|uniref:hypothetical protein n=1 Tax=Amycolatopsis sp. WGS_07 TaxID=3076764 RepID=UPI003872B185
MGDPGDLGVEVGSRERSRQLRRERAIDEVEIEVRLEQVLGVGVLGVGELADFDQAVAGQAAVLAEPLDRLGVLGARVDEDRDIESVRAQQAGDGSEQLPGCPDHWGRRAGDDAETGGFFDDEGRVAW